ncbi:hypothetical protein [Emticicia sp. SJ17W-69]|uniref:hypothetical protein n=1 Tax=Emticicia sp. SJ17W-69 TaxID=3421657 RepID=UPI003EBD330E
MKKLEIKEMGNYSGGSMSYGAGAVCGLALVGTFVSIAAGPAGVIAMGSVTGSLCAGSIWAAWNE